jgi:hypothetical protein
MDFAVVIGMHSDQGTEPAVRYAVKYDIPLAVVPCCVFPTQFPNREFRGGGVNGYKTFVKYLRSLCPEKPQIHTLPFKGRNTVLYTEQQRKG